MNKRYLTVIAAIALIAVAIVGCNKAQTDEGEKDKPSVDKPDGVKTGFAGDYSTVVNDKLVNLSLKEDKNAELSTQAKDNKPEDKPEVRKGTWSDDGKVVTVKLDGEEMTFEINDKNELAATKFDKAAWGEHFNLTKQ